MAIRTQTPEEYPAGALQPPWLRSRCSIAPGAAEQERGGRLPWRPGKMGFGPCQLQRLPAPSATAAGTRPNARGLTPNRLNGIPVRMAGQSPPKQRAWEEAQPWGPLCSPPLQAYPQASSRPPPGALGQPGLHEPHAKRLQIWLGKFSPRSVVKGFLLK